MVAHSHDAQVLFDSGRMHYGRLPMVIFGGVYLIPGIAFLGATLSGALQAEPPGLALPVIVILIVGFLSRGYSRIRWSAMSRG